MHRFGGLCVNPKKGQELAGCPETSYTRDRALYFQWREDHTRRLETLVVPVEVFYSCAEADAPLLDRLENHLSVLRQEGLITTWHKRQIAAGEDWQRELDRRLRTASLVLVLISPDFLASDYLYGVELQQGDHAKKGAGAAIPHYQSC